MSQNLVQCVVYINSHTLSRMGVNWLLLEVQPNGLAMVEHVRQKIKIVSLTYSNLLPPNFNNYRKTINIA